MRKVYIIRVKKLFPEHERDVFPRTILVTEDKVYDDYKKAQELRNKRIEELCVIYGKPLPCGYKRSNVSVIPICVGAKISITLTCTDAKRESRRVQNWRERHADPFCRNIDQYEGNLTIRGRKAYNEKGMCVFELEPLNAM